MMSQVFQQKSLTAGAVRCHKLTVAYQGYRALECLSGAFESGSLTAVVGPNGGGKTTLLNVINGIIPPTAGYVDLSKVKASQIAYLPQRSRIDRSFPLLVSDVVAMGLCTQIGFYRRVKAAERKLINQTLETVGMERYAERSLHTLSGGEFQRVLFARMSMQNSPIVLLDEPFAAIDTPTMEILANVLCRWQQQGRTIISVMHDLDIVREFFPSTLILARSSVAWGKTADILTLENLLQAKKQLRDYSSNTGTYGNV